MSSLPTRLLAGTVLGLLGLGPLASSFQAGAHGEEASGPVRSLLDSGTARGEALQKIVDLGPGAIPEVIDLLSGQGAPARLDQRLPGLSAGDDTFLRKVLAKWPEERLGSALLERIDDETTLDTRLWSMRLLAGVGGVRSLPMMLQLVEGVEPVHFRRKFVSGQVESALTEILTRDDAAYLSLEVDSASLSPELQQCVARALARMGGSRSVELILGMLGRDGDLDRVVLGELANLEGGAVHPIALTKLPAVRAFVTDDDAKKRELAVLALGRLHDADSFAEMLSILSQGDPVMARCALSSLQRMSGVQWPEDPELWSSWFEREQEWLANDAPRLAEVVRAGEVAAAASAGRELSAHPLFRKEVTEALRRGLEHTDPAVVAVCCGALERVSGIGATKDLIELLSPGRSDAVRTAAHEALVAMTGESFPAREQPWKAWLER